MAVLHAALAWLAIASILAVLVAAAAPALGRSASYRWLDRAVLGQLAVTALAGLSGAATFATVGAPRDALHLLYGLVSALLPVVARVFAQGRDAQAIGRWVAVAALLTLGAAIRSFMTGA